MIVNVPDSAYASGVLDKDYHARLVADLGRLSKKAGIPAQFVWSRLADYCTEEEIDWMRQFRSSDSHGLVITSTLSAPAESKMMAMVGAFLRNYINARMMTVQEVLGYMKTGAFPNTSVVLVPNFCMSKTDNSPVAHWEPASLLSWLYSRLVDEQKTVLFVGSMKVLEEAYGESMVKHLKTYYKIV